MTHRFIKLLCLAGLSLLACTSTDSLAREIVAVPAPLQPLKGTAYDAAVRVSLPAQDGSETYGMKNVFTLGDSLISGSEPEGEEAFQRLQELGVRTILSVDGKVPNEALATQYGMRYVHVPIEYRGIDDDQLFRIVKTFRELERPFYVHCFHGVHRGPAAAAVGRLVMDGVSREQALAEMRQWCGTSSSYEGLYQVVATREMPGALETNASDWDFPAAHQFEGFRGGMIAAARAYDRLKTLSNNDWKPTSDHPDVDRVNEVTQLLELITRCSELEEALSRPADHQEMMSNTIVKTTELRDLLTGLGSSADAKMQATETLRAMKASCVDCHVVYRNQ